LKFQTALVAHHVRAQSMAMRHTPSVFHELTHESDVLGNIGQDEPVAEAYPEVYYSVRIDDDYHHVFYGFYHARDCSHRHDFEGVQYSVPHKGDEIIAMARSHFNIKAWVLHPYSRNLILIRGSGHSIRRANEGEPRGGNMIFYDRHNFSLKNMHTDSGKIEKQVRSMGNAVMHPEQWRDVKIDKRKAWLRANYKTSSTRGLFWLRPTQLIHIYTSLKLIEP